LTKVIQMMN